MNTNSVEDGYELQLGDVIIAKHALGKNRHVVTRVTKKYAFVKFNDVAEGKFPRIFDFHFESLPRQQWNTVHYTVERAKS